MAKTEFLMLSHVYDPDRHWIGGWFMSEKLDGSRCLWDGGMTIGLPISHIPFANCDKKAHRLSEPVSTGLWSRYGNVIHAPSWFINTLPPNHLLDGELWGGRRRFQETRSTVSNNYPDDRWHGIKFMVFDSPAAVKVFWPRQISTTNFSKIFNNQTLEWVLGRHKGHNVERTFESTVQFLKILLEGNEVAKAHNQIRLPFSESQAREIIESELGRVTDMGGEGLMLRAAHSLWTFERSHHLIKIKKLLDDEGILVGYTAGRETDKGSRLLGKIGALILDYKGKRLELSGMTDTEREFATPDAKFHAKTHPGEDMPSWAVANEFVIGQEITFHYRELSNDGIPKESRFWRK